MKKVANIPEEINEFPKKIKTTVKSTELKTHLKYSRGHYVLLHYHFHKIFIVKSSHTELTTLFRRA